MFDFLYGVFAEYGMPALSWVLVAVGGLGAKYLWGRLKNDWARGVLSRAYVEISAAVKEVAQTYTDAIKQGRDDGKLTYLEKQRAKSLALKIAKQNIGKKGLVRLARVLDLESVAGWLDNKTEVAVRNTRDPWLA